jgi:hypothetical protein
MATLTALATVLVICAATQDIAVDGPCAPVRGAGSATEAGGRRRQGGRSRCCRRHTARTQRRAKRSD